MIFKRFAWLILFITGFQTSYSQFTDLINSNRPGESFGAFSVGKTIFQTEGGVSYINEKHSKTDTKIQGIFGDLDLRYGFWRDELEFVVNLQYREDQVKIDSTVSFNQKAFKNSVFGFKYLVYDPFKNYDPEWNVLSWKANQKFRWRQLLPAVALYGGANINLSKNNPYLYQDEENISAKGMVALQHHIQEGWVFVTNLLIDKIGTDYMTYGGILTITKNFTQRWSGFAEVQGYKNDYQNDFIVRGGAAYLYLQDLQFDVSIGKNFHDTRDVIYGGIGVSWRFTANYQDVVTYKVTQKSDKEKEKEKKKKNKKDKKRKNKRQKK